MEEDLINLAHEVCRKSFMNYPDYDPEIEIDIVDALTVLVTENIPHDSKIESDKVYDFLETLIKTGKDV